MAEYQITFASSALKDLSRLEPATAKRLLAKVEGLSLDPRPIGCRKLEGTRGLWRLRVGDYRVIYTIDDDRHLLDVIIVRHRRDVYR